MPGFGYLSEQGLCLLARNAAQSIDITDISTDKCTGKMNGMDE
jgi:hypothetical protein